MTPVVDFQNVSFSYPSGQVLENVSLQIPHGDFVSIVGPNGGGKTTMLKLMLGLLPPQTGTVRLFDTTPVSARHRIGYMPQFIHIDDLFPLTVLDVVLMGRIGTVSEMEMATTAKKSVFGRWQEWLQWYSYSLHDRQVAMTSLETLRLADCAHRPFRYLSGGQRQRVLIARALCCNPMLLLLDEPTNNIDVSSEEILFEILVQLNRTLTIVLVSHDIGFVTQWVKSVVCVNRTVAVHPTSTLTGQMVRELYGSGIEMVRHNHRCCPTGHATTS